MEFNAFADQFLYFVQRLGGNTQSRQIRDISSPSGYGFFVDNQIFHFSPACFKTSSSIFLIRSLTFKSLIPQRFTRLQRELDPLLGLLFAAERLKPFSL